MKENGIKNNIAIKAAFLRYGISKARERLNVDEQCYPYISLLCYRQTLKVIFTFFSCTTQYTFQCVFSHCFTCFPLFLIDQCGVRQRTYSIYQFEMLLFNFEIRILEFEATILECNNSEKLLQLNLRRNFRGMKFWRCRGWYIKLAKLKRSQKYFVSSSMKLKWRKTKFLNQNVKLKCREKNLWKLICENKMPQKYIILLKLSRLQIFFQNQVSYFLDEIKNRPGNLYEKNWSKTRISSVKTGRFYIKLCMSIFIRENFWIFKSSCRLRWWGWRYFQTRQTFLWCF